MRTVRMVEQSRLLNLLTLPPPLSLPFPLPRSFALNPRRIRVPSNHAKLLQSTPSSSAKGNVSNSEGLKVLSKSKHPPCTAFERS